MNDQILAEREVARAAYSWWRNIRPLGWTVAMHIENPYVNSSNAASRDLCVALARLARLKYKKKSLRAGKGKP